MDENVTVTLTLDEAVKTLIQLTALDIMLCKEILRGDNVDNNINMLGVNNNVHNVIYEQIEDVIGNSYLSGAYALYRETLHGLLVVIDIKLYGGNNEE